ncbi:MAG: PVC-type heme-binding CxxCH protein [Pirellula sp.]
MLTRIRIFLAASAASVSMLSGASLLNATEPTATKNIVFIAGGRSHDFGSHEHYAGSRILAEAIQKTDPNAKVDVIQNGWPKDDSMLDTADSIVIYSDGGGGHPSLPHLERLRKQMDRGVGFVCIHYAVEVPKDRGGPEFLSWLGGYFETNWSVNPHWDAKFESLPKHPITSGVKPFQARDEWYFHMRFPDDMKGVTPILSAVPPASTMDRADGLHSGNPTVRKEVARGDKQHVAWATERPNGGRSFGFTGGHFHWNWGRTEPTRLVANAILWTAHLPVPETGAVVEQKNVEQLKANQDEPVPTDPNKFDPEKITKTFQLISSNDVRPNGGLPNDGRTSDKAVDGLVVGNGLKASLAASEPMLKSLTNIDVDHKGRIWVCEVVNYRKHRDDRKEGDRILILEDTNQDGVVDTSKVFYQGRDIDSALGLCVLGNRVLVSAAPYVWEFIDENGDDIPDSKKAILTKTGDAQHDHSVHSFVFGPDGKLYFNYGNTGHRLCDSNGNPIKDRWGREINDAGKPYRQGMVFRCNEDLSDMEVLGHNFRNNYEISVDSFGALWQSDNDDDGNRATRINFVMEFGNYGYVEETTGAGWQSDRTNRESDIPSRHWHLNDPGVVPNLILTGAGSPTGITIYEGALLPERFRNQIIHCDAGPSVVRAYVTESKGAGYSASIENIAVGEHDPWFRPADVSVAPDGSLFVSDWYDPGVGGHNMQDMERGRLFRIAPPGVNYSVPKLDFTTAAGAVNALRNPNNAARYMAYKALVRMGAGAVSELNKLAMDANPRMRARALWLLSKLEDTAKVVKQASKDSDPDVRCTAIRIARQANFATKDYVPGLLGDASPRVLRELAVALREDKSDEMPGYWVNLTKKFDGKDRWYLEALGIAAMDRWESCLNAWLRISPDKNSLASQQIIWRSRGPKAAQLQAEMLRNGKIKESDIPALFRALDLQDAESLKKALRTLLDLASNDSASEQPKRDRIVVEALMRLDDLDVQADDKLMQAVRRHLGQLKDDPSQLRMIQKLKVPVTTERMIELALAWGANTQSVQALDLAAEQGGLAKLVKLLSTKDPDERIVSLSKVLSLSNRRDVHDALLSLIEQEGVAKAVKVDAAVGLARNKSMHSKLIELAKADKLPVDAKMVIGATLRNSDDNAVKTAARELFPTLKTSQNQLPPMEVLLKRNGNAASGKVLYMGVATCSQCHIVGTEGKNVGPNLSEIGNKLSKEAMYVSILAPSAGISHNFESYAARTDDDEVVVGLMVSDAPESVTIRDAKGIERTIPRKNLSELKKQEKSLMPESLQETMDVQGIVDLVEYLMSLKK